MSTTPVGINTSNPIVTRQSKKRDLETTMTTLKQLLEPTMKKGSRKKNKPRSIAKKVIPPKKVSRFENTMDDGEYYPNKLKRKVRMKKTVLRPKHDLKVVVATNKRKRCTPHKGLDPSVLLTDSGQHNTELNSSSIYTNLDTIKNASRNSSAIHVQTTPDYNLKIPNNTECLNVHTPKTNSQNHMYKLISPPHKSLTQLTVDDLIRMDEDSLSGEDMMEILTCPSPVWWEDPADIAQGTVYLTQASEFSTPLIEQSEINTRQERMELKRSSICVSASKARKIAKLENILGHIKSLVSNDVRGDSIKNIGYNNGYSGDKNEPSVILKAITDRVNEPKSLVRNNVRGDSIKNIGYNNGDSGNKNGPSVILKAITDRVNEPEANETDRKRRKISSSDSEISVNEDELLRNLENIDIPIEIQEDKDSRNNDKDERDKETKNSNDNIPIDVDDIDDLTDTEKEPKSKTVATHNKQKLRKRKKKKITEKKVEPPVAKKLINKGKRNNNNDHNKKDTKNNVSKRNYKKIKPAKPYKSVTRELEKPNNDILDVRLVKVPKNVTNEVKVWSPLENFKRHNSTPDTAIDSEEEFEITISADKNEPKENDPLEIKHETILIDDDSNDFDVNTGIDVVSINVIEHHSHVTIPTTDDTSCNSEIIELDSAKDIIEYNEDISGNKKGKNDRERNIIKEDTIRISNDLDIKLIETSDVQDTKNKTPKEQNNVKISKVKSICNNMPTESTELHKTAPFKSTPAWHVNNYLKFDDKTNDRGIFRVEDTDDATDTILCLNDVDVSLVKNPRLKVNETNTVKVNESINDVSITLVSKCTKGGTFNILPKLTKVVTESPKSVQSNISESTAENSDTISDTNIHFLDEYEDSRNVHIKDKSDANIIDKTKNSDTNKPGAGNIIDLELDQDTIDVVCLTNEEETLVDDESTDYEDNVNIDDGKPKNSS